MKSSKIWKTLMLVGSQAMLFGLGGSCLPDNFLADAAGQVANRLLVDGFNMLVAGAGLPI